jgi:hypothetical protein
MKNTSGMCQILSGPCTEYMEHTFSALYDLELF